MKEILILGALPKEERRKNLYELMVNVCKKYANSVSSPIDTLEFRGTGRERYDLAFQKVRSANLIIGELSEPSTGQGMEIREATILNKPVLIVARSESKISGLVTECPAVKKIIYYESNQDLELRLEEYLQERRV